MITVTGTASVKKVTANYYSNMHSQHAIAKGVSWKKSCAC